MIFLLIWKRECSCCLGNNFSAGLRLGTLGTSSVQTYVEGCEPHRGTSQRNYGWGRVMCIFIGKGQLSPVTHPCPAKNAHGVWSSGVGNE